MAVEEIEKLVDAPLVFAPKKIKKTIFRTSDGTEFEKNTVATRYETEYLFREEFKKHFSEEKNNFIIGTKELSENLVMESERIYIDYFWVKIGNKQEREILENFCKKVYELAYSNLFEKNDCSDIGWIYIMAIKDNGTYWISKKQLERDIQITQNNFPENIKTNKITRKKVTRSELIDI